MKNDNSLVGVYLLTIVVAFMTGLYVGATRARVAQAITPLPRHPQAKGPIEQARADFRAICLYENRGVIRDQYNEAEQSRGPAQVRPGYLKDANEWLAKHGMRIYTHDEMGDYDKAFAVFCAYMARYGRETTEERARAHNGAFASHEATQKYWEGVEYYVGK